VTLPIEDLQLFCVNLAFVTLLAAVYAALIYFGSEKYSFQIWEVVALIGIYLVYLAVMFFGVLNII